VNIYVFLYFLDLPFLTYVCGNFYLNLQINMEDSEENVGLSGCVFCVKFYVISSRTFWVILSTFLQRTCRYNKIGQCEDSAKGTSLPPTHTLNLSGATENAGVENVAPSSSGGKRGSKWQSCLVSGNVSSYTNLNRPTWMWDVNL